VGLAEFLIVTAKGFADVVFDIIALACGEGDFFAEPAGELDLAFINAHVN
jgi:hypothetical protein